LFLGERPDFLFLRNFFALSVIPDCAGRLVRFFFLAHMGFSLLGQDSLRRFLLLGFTLDCSLVFDERSKPTQLALFFDSLSFLRRDYGEISSAVFPCPAFAASHFSILAFLFNQLFL